MSDMNCIYNTFEDKIFVDDEGEFDIHAIFFEVEIYDPRLDFTDRYYGTFVPGPILGLDYFPIQGRWEVMELRRQSE